MNFQLKFLAVVILIVIFSVASSSISTALAIDQKNPLQIQNPSYNPQILPGSDVRFVQYTGDQGLSMSVVNSIAQDRKGFLWFATQDGLNRFDGHGFRILKHDPDILNTLSANWINALLVDSTGVIWIGTEGGGLDRYNPNDGKFLHFVNDPNNPESISSNNISSLYEDRSGVIWVVTTKGLDGLDRLSSRFTHLKDDANLPQELKNAEITAIQQDRSGNLWLATKIGLVRRDSSSRKYQLYKHDESDPTSLSNDYVKTTLEDLAGNLWVGTRGGGLNRFNSDTKTFSHYELGSSAENTESAGSHMINAINEDPTGHLWIGTWGGGLFYFDPQTGKSIQFRAEFGNPNSLSSDYITDIFRDRSGSVWIGTFGGGLSKFDIGTLFFTHYRKRLNDSNSLINNTIWSVFEDSGVLWIGTDGGLSRLDRNSGVFNNFFHDPTRADSLLANNVMALYKDHLGDFWVGIGGGGLNLFNPQTGGFREYLNDPKDANSLSNNRVSGILEDQKNNLWIATREGLNKFNRDSGMFTKYASDPTNPETLIDNSITAIILNRAGRFWIGTYTGLCEFDPDSGKARRFSIKPKFEEGSEEINVLSIYEDSSGVLWLGTVGRGLIRFDPHTGDSSSYREKEGLPNDTVYGILADDHGKLWMSTNNGLTRFDPLVGDFKVFSAQDGLQGNEFNSGAYFKSENGEMFFGGINGLSAFFPDEIQSNSFIPPVALISIGSNETSINSGDPPENLDQASIRYPDTAFEFEFASLSFVQPERNQYAYKLENFDRDWNYVGSKNFGRYTNLPGGEYTLHLKASNNDGIWNEEGQSIRIEVIPPFWGTLWFRIGIVLFGLMVILAGYRLRVRSVVHHSRQLETLVHERTREIEHRRNELEALYSADEALYRNLQLDQVLHALVMSAVNLLHADKGSLFVADKEKRYLTARVTYGFKSKTMEKLSIAFGEGVAGRVAQSGEPIFVEDARLDDRVTHQIVDYEGICSIMQVPIKVGGEVFGVFSADYTSLHPFENDELRLLMSLAQRAALAIQNAQIYEKTQEEAVTEERNRLARELHDAVTQTLFSASLIAEALPGAFQDDSREGMELLNELRQLNRGALAEMRTLLMELRPAALTEARLEDLLHQLGEAAAGREGIPVIVQTNGHYQLPADVHIALYRIAQEALNNSLKHARADQIAINLKKYTKPDHPMQVNSGEGIQLTVHDNGRGFDLKNTPADHLGLKIMRERAQSIGALLTIDSEKGKGTQVTVLWEDNHI